MISKDVNHNRASPVMPKRFSSWHRSRLWSTQSKAADMSSKTKKGQILNLKMELSRSEKSAFCQFRNKVYFVSRCVFLEQSVTYVKKVVE